MWQKGVTSMTRLSRYRQKNKKHKKNAVILAILMIILSVFDVLTNSTVNAASSHTTTLDLSSEQVRQNSSITLKAEARINGNISTSGFTYRFLYNTTGASKATILSEYSNSNVYTFKPGNIESLKNYTGPVYIFADAKNSSGTSVWSKYKILNIISNDDEALKATGSVTSAGNYTVGDPLIITMTASGGKAPYTYKYEYCLSGNNYSTYKNYTETSSVTMPTSSWTANTDYNVKVTVKDSDNKTFSYISAVRLSAKPVPDPAISSFTVQSTAKIGEKVRLSCIASSGTKPYKYKFTYTTPSGSEKIIKENVNDTDYTDKAYRNWDTSGLSEGNYTIKAIVKDSKGKSATKTTNIKISKSPYLSPTISTDPANATVVKGKDITFIINDHSDNSENSPLHPYKYKFEYKQENGSYQSMQAYSDNEKCKYNTKSLSAGNYTVKATVKDNNGKEYSKTCNFTVTVPKITFSVDPGSKDFFTGGGNDKAVIEVKNIKGGTSDEYEYKFEYIKYGELTDPTLTPPTNSADWQSIKDFSSESSVDFTVENNENAGIYAVRVSVQNKDNTDNDQIYRQIIQNYTVKVKVQHTLADINSLISKIDTWTSNSIQGDMQNKIESWSPGSEHYNTVPFSYTDYKAAYDAAKASNTNGNKDYDTLYANLETQFDKLQRLVNSGYVSPDLEEGDTPIGIAHSVFLLYKGLLSVITDTFKSLADSSVTSTVMYGFDYNAIADKIFPLFRTFAYALIIIFAGVNALETALQYEMFTMRGGVKILARLTFAKIWVDISLVVCRGIVAIATEWLNQITTLTSNIANNINIGVSLQSSNAWIIGWLIDFFNGLLLAFGMLLLIIPLIVLIIIMFAKLFIRSFELAMLQCVSPVFFACLTGETTKQYFNKFILTYISVVVEVVFMALIWYIYIEYLNQAFSVSSSANSVLEFFSLENGIINFFMVSIGAYILMIKPPQVLKNLVSA